jgi:hypothetical protein
MITALTLIGAVLSHRVFASNVSSFFADRRLTLGTVTAFAGDGAADSCGTGANPLTRSTTPIFTCSSLAIRYLLVFLFPSSDLESRREMCHHLLAGVNPAGTHVYAVIQSKHAIRVINIAGNTNTIFAGTCNTNGNAASSRFDTPWGMYCGTFGPGGSYYVADMNNNISG